MDNYGVNVIQAIMDKFAAMGAFVQVVEANGFAAAARQMGLSRSAVNKLVITLETELGVQLLQRSTRKVTATATGIAFYGRCLAILADLEAAELAVSQAQSAPVGPLRINAPMTFGTLHLGPVLADFMVQYPGVQVQLTLEDRFIDPLAEGFDLTLRIAEPRPSPQLVMHELAQLECLLCAAPGYLREYGCPQTVEDLRHHSCLAYGELASRHGWVLVNADGIERTVMVKGAMCSNNGEVLRDGAIRGLGLVVLPRFIVEKSLGRGELQAVGLDCWPRSLSLWVMYPISRHLSAKVQLLTDFLRTSFGADGVAMG